MSSTAAAAISRREALAPASSPAAKARSGRTRLPPSSVAYRMAEWRRTGATCAAGKTRARAASMPAWTCVIQDWKSVSVRFTGLALAFGADRRSERLENLPFQDLDLLLRSLQLLLAETGELEPALVRCERLLQRQLAAFHARNDFFQLGERRLEGRAASYGLAHRLVRYCFSRGFTT